MRIRRRGKFNIPKLHPFDRALYAEAVNRAVENLIRRINIGLINLMNFALAFLLRSRKFFIAARGETGFSINPSKCYIQGWHALVSEYLYC